LGGEKGDTRALGPEEGRKVQGGKGGDVKRLLDVTPLEPFETQGVATQMYSQTKRKGKRKNQENKREGKGRSNMAVQTLVKFHQTNQELRKLFEKIHVN